MVTTWAADQEYRENSLFGDQQCHAEVQSYQGKNKLFWF